MVDGWFPDLNALGDVISGGGIGQITLNGKQIAVGTSPKWVDNNWIVFNSAKPSSRTTLMNVRTGEKRDRGTAYTSYAGGGGTWGGLFQAAPIHADFYANIDATAPSISVANGGKVAISSIGGRLYYDNFTGSNHRVLYNGTEIGSGPVVDLSVCSTGAAWTVATSVYGRKVMYWPLFGAARDVSVGGGELLPAITEGAVTGTTPWILTGLQSGTCIRPAGSSMGYFRAGDLFNPCVKFLGGVFRVVGSDAHGAPVEWHVDPSVARIDLAKIGAPAPAHTDAPHADAPQHADTPETPVSNVHIAMPESLVPGAMGSFVEASWKGMKPGVPLDTATKNQWISYGLKVDTYSDNIDRQGWNAYLEARMTSPSGADPKLGDQKSRFQPGTPPHADAPPHSDVPHSDVPPVNTLQQQIDILRGRVDALEAAGFARTGDPVTVSGKVSFSDTLSGKVQTWTGVIK